MKSLLLFLIVFIFGILLALWSPWMNLNISLSKIFGVEEPDKIAGLQVYSLAGDLNIYIDGELKGTAEENNGAFIVDRVEPGSRLVRLERKTTNEFSYFIFNKLVTFTEGKNVIISYNIGPEEEFSEGNVISVLNSDEKIADRTKINVYTNIESASVSIGNLANQTIIENNRNSVSQTVTLDRQYKVIVSKPGYETLEFTLLPSDQGDRQKFEGYEINVEVYLMTQPLKVE